LVDPLDGVRLVFLDMDGVIYRGGVPINGAAEAVAKLRERVGKVLFTTNNATLSRRAYVKKLRGMGIKSEESEILTSAYTMARYLKSLHEVKALPIGEKGLVEELHAAAVPTVDLRCPEEATHVVAGLDRKLNYWKIAAAAKAIFSGAKFVATNVDATYPTESGMMPGAGATIGAISGCTGKGPDVVIGKPSPLMLELGMRISGVRKNDVAIIGDRLDTDVAVARKLKIRSILLLTGVSTLRDVRRAHRMGESPDFVYESLAEVVS